MDDIEAARLIDQALFNLPKGYPYKDETHEAFGKLIIGRLGIRRRVKIILPYEENKWTIVEDIKG